MPRGGARIGAGRKPGAASTRTREIADAIAEGLTPLEYLASIYRDETKDEMRRIDAAKAAAPYVHAKLANIEGNFTGDFTVGQAIFKGLNDNPDG
jgi:UDP:flavonoid glycosyltransferase YjiC (YdhE family)